MSEYGRRTTPVGARVLTSQIVDRWRMRSLSGNAQTAVPSQAETPSASPVVDDTPQRRHALRKKTLLGGKIVFNDLMSVIDCSIRDFSDGGARLKLNAPVTVPQAFILRFADGHVRQCMVRRRNALELGVEFLN